MLPFLDPGSDIFEEPDRWGYTLFHRTLEEHRGALVAPPWRTRLNYQTADLDREALVRVSYAAVQRLTELKVERGLLPTAVGAGIVDRLGETRALLDRIEDVLSLPGGPERDARWGECRREIRGYNDVHTHVVRSQQRPVDLGFADRQWFDTDGEIEAVLGR